jgi:hypothetical protein
MTTMGVRTPVVPRAVAVVRRVAALGGMYSNELGIDLDEGDSEIARWFLAATLFGTRISGRTAERTFTVLDRAGVTAENAAEWAWTTLVELLDEGGYTRYDYKTATRLQELSRVLYDRYGGSVGAIESSVASAAELEVALDALPGWGVVTVDVFLRELRGIWRHADPPLSELVLGAGRHLGVLGGGEDLVRLRSLAQAASLDVRDVECALVRLGIAHHRAFGACPGGARCRFLPT